MIRAVFGGSFDPFHNGHLALVRALLDRRLADEVLVVPACRAPGKPEPVAPAADRLAMCRAALAGLAGVEVRDDEIVRGGVSYSVDTLEALAAVAPDVALRLVVGDDALAGFHRWRRPERILELARLLVFARRGAASAVPPGIAAAVDRVADFDMPVASTDLRRRLARGERPVDLLPAGVLDHIARRGLYGAASSRD